MRNLQDQVSMGNVEAFTKIYQFFQNKLTIFSTALIHSKTIAEEVVEDVFIRLWINHPKINTIENLQVYLYTAVKNRSLNAINSINKKIISEPFDTLDTQIQSLDENPAEKLISTEMLKKVDLAIQQLPPKCKMIFKLVREDGLKYKEVAAILNISVNTIDAQMAIAVKRIAETIGISKPTIKMKTHTAQKKLKLLGIFW